MRESESERVWKRRRECDKDTQWEWHGKIKPSFIKSTHTHTHEK